MKMFTENISAKCLILSLLLQMRYKFYEKTQNHTLVINVTFPQGWQCMGYVRQNMKTSFKQFI